MAGSAIVCAHTDAAAVMQNTSSTAAKIRFIWNSIFRRRVNAKPFDNNDRFFPAWGGAFEEN